MKNKSIKEIAYLLFEKNAVEDAFLKNLREDPRKGVQLLLDRWDKREEEKRRKHESFLQLKGFDAQYRKADAMIAGIDEVGRGPLAGPVVAAAVIVDRNFYLPGINDSKQLTKKQRENYYSFIMENAISVGIGAVDSSEIDRINIYEATKLAMTKAVQGLTVTPSMLLVDAMVVPLAIDQEKVIKGDQKSLAIAASSIVAKVTRDRLMSELGCLYPQYGFEDHMGYGTEKHIEAIKEHGVIKEHRRTFAPIKDMLTWEGGKDDHHTKGVRNKI